MNISTGIYRLAQVIKWGGRVLGCIFIVGGLFGDRDWVVPIAFGVLFLVVTATIAWVLEGFAKN